MIYFLRSVGPICAVYCEFLLGLSDAVLCSVSVDLILRPHQILFIGTFMCLKQKLFLSIDHIL
jgi:hypothetical protein